MNAATTQPVEVSSGDLDTCPRHGAEVKGEYDFGMEDATVITFRCGCAACIDRSDGFGDRATLYPYYSAAAGMARMITAAAKAFTHRYGI